MMKIGICGPANPYEFKTYLFEKDIPNVNGNAASVNAHIQSLLDLGNEVFVFTRYYSKTHEIKRLEGKNLHFILFPNSDTRIENIFRFHFIRAIRKELIDDISKLDVLHAQWTYEYAFACIPFASQIPFVCTVRDWYPYQVKLLKRPMEKAIWKMNGFFFRSVMNCKDIHFIANSEYTYQCIKGYRADSDVTKIYNGIKSQFIRQQRLDYPVHPRFVTIAQNLSEKRKNIHTLLTAFHRLREDIQDAELTMIGFYQPSDFQQWKEEGLLEGVSLSGPLDHDQVIKYLDSCSCLVHPSEEETFGNILLEGMARRIPVIGGQDSGAVPLVLGQGKYGILCDIHQAASLYNAMMESTHLDALQEKINLATKYITENYSSDIIGQRHMELYRKLTNNNQTK